MAPQCGVMSFASDRLPLRDRLHRVALPSITAIAPITLALLTGCGNPYGYERNPSFPAGQMAAAPVVTYPVLDCTGGSSTTLDETLRLVLEQRGANKPSRASFAAAPDTRAHLCGFVKSNPPPASHYVFSFGETSDAWQVPLALGASVQKLSAANGAASNVFVLTERIESCAAPSSTVTDDKGRPVARVQSSQVVCTPTSSFLVHSLVFSSKSELLWSGSETVDTTRVSDMDRSLQALARRIPAAFGDPDPAATTTTTSARTPATVAGPPAPPPPATTEPPAAESPPPAAAPVVAPEPPIPGDVPWPRSRDERRDSARAR